MTSRESNPIAYARGVLEVEAEEFERQRDKALQVLEYLTATVRGGQQWQMDHAVGTAQALIDRHRADS